MTVVVYTAPGCIPCKLTKKHLDKLGIPYDEEPVEHIVGYAKRHGITSAPVVAAAGQMWGGYRPDKLDALATGTIEISTSG